MMVEADVSLIDNFVTDPDGLLDEVLRTTKWQDQTIHSYGRSIPLPRGTAWYGDPGTVYAYSGISNVPLPWTKVLSEIRTAVQAHCDTPFNSVLLNHYRTGKDSIAWHSDDEPELGDCPVIASVSLGSTRLFQFKHKHKPDLKASIALTHGSLLVMRGHTQANWLHQVPKTVKPVGARINLTFRVIVPKSHK